jgi:FMN-dependent NADH-azoreductase
MNPLSVLHVQSSALGTASVSRAVGAALQAQLPEGTRAIVRDLAAAPLPHWTPTWAGSAEASAVVDELLGAEVLILEVPMYNFGIPSTLKAWLDTVAVAGRTFHYTAEGPQGHLTGLRVILVSARGGRYGEGHVADFQEAYVRHLLGFLGVTADRITVVRAEGLAMGEDARAQGLADAQTHLAAVAF